MCQYVGREGMSLLNDGTIKSGFIDAAYYLKCHLGRAMGFNSCPIKIEIIGFKLEMRQPGIS